MRGGGTVTGRTGRAGQSPTAGTGQAGATGQSGSAGQPGPAGRAGGIGPGPARVRQVEAELASEGLLLVCGPPGIGKTALLDAVTERALARGDTVVRLCPQPPDRAVPFAVAADLLLALPRHHVERLPAPQRRAAEAVLRHETPSDGGPDPLAVRLALTAVLRATAPALVVIDQAHCADPAGAAALTCLRGTGTAVLGAVPTGDDAPEFLDGAPRFTVAPLTVDEVAALLEGERLPSRLAGRIHRAGGGNPRIALDIGRAVAALTRPPHPLDDLPVPDRVAAMARRALAAVPASARRTLLTAALADRPTSALLRRAEGRDVEEELRAARHAGIVALEGDELRFSADVLAYTLVHDSGWSERSAAHHALADATADAVAAARHRALARDDLDATLAADLETAAATARTRGDRGTAAGLGLLAARRTPVSQHADAVRRFAAAADDAGRAGRADLARRAAAEVLEHSERRAERVAALLSVIDAAGQALDDLDEVFARAAAEAGDDHGLLAAVSLRHAWKANLCDGDPVRARGAAARAAALAERAGQPGVAVMALTMRARLERVLGDPAAETSLRRALAAAVPAEPVGVRNQPRYLKVRHDLFDDRLDRARAGLLDLLPLAERSGDTEDLVEILRSLAETETRAGRCATALRHADRAVRVTTAAGQSPGPSWYTAAFAEAAGGTFERARAFALRGVRASQEEHDQVFLSRSLHVLGTVQLVTGSAAEAVEQLSRVRDHERAQQVADPSLLRWHADLAEALGTAGRVAEAESVIEQYARVARELERHSTLAALDRAGAVTLTARGEPEPAAALLESAAERFAALGLPLECGRCLWLLSRTRLRLRRRAAARRALTEARGLFAAAAAHAWHGLVDEALTRLDAGGAKGGAGELTTSEGQLAALVAAGASNREAAAQLHLSVKTVETMLTRIYRKTGVHSRAQLAAARAGRA
ncbi:AAA family ATPase [Streptomyces monticola]|uniref:AAA family ATPase n=1 Tax=Streptomyces monticola TaxID=2666263 RepID=A0ABW2JF45_9ACTN